VRDSFSDHGARGHTSAKIDAARAYGAEVIVGGDLNNVEPLIEKPLPWLRTGNSYQFILLRIT